ncbi:MAG: hypothetical protein Salg2KO_04980 [Salibacteraceae bacterium]
MNKQLILLILSCVASAGAVSAQSVIASAGESYEGNNAQMSYTLGETVIATHSVDSNQMTQGFHQSKLNVVGISEDFKSVSVKVWPNPTTDFVTIDFDQNAGVYDLILLDQAGQLVKSQSAIGDSQYRLEMRSLASGSYFLNIVSTQDRARRNTYQIIKTH